MVEPEISRASMTGDVIRQDSAYYQVQETPAERRRNITYGIRHFHNSIKRDLYIAAAKYTSIGVVLDLGGGRGGDLPKYRAIRAKTVVVVEKDWHGLEEFKRRLSARDNVLLVHGDMTKPLLLDAAYNVGDQQLLRQLVGPGVNLVTCQFALHYAFEDATAYTNLLINLHSSLNIGGHFIGTVVDGSSMRGILKTTGAKTFVVDDKPFADISVPFPEKIDQYLGAAIDVTFASISDIPRREYLVEFNQLKDDLTAFQIVLPEPVGNLPRASGLFEEFPDFQKLSNAEKVYSKLHRYFMFQRAGPGNPFAIENVLRKYQV